jgi:hypothetical protein
MRIQLNVTGERAVSLAAMQRNTSQLNETQPTLKDAADAVTTSTTPLSYMMCMLLQLG